ncbi:hypothetical protein QAD02_006152 [Eretmocerus hayati]|uniref:Uncharacterized protein n=1 Tax=Eretmocerus hayati TaxID=131215 RepID=A0ACC2N074_9HYME|nr:hypothetical protein QAD02_006152 [Eretmocerus hayati]
MPEAPIKSGQSEITDFPGCFVNMSKDFHWDSPIFVNDSDLTMIHPKSGTPNYLFFQTCSNQQVFCHGGDLIISGHNTGQRSDILYCQGDDQFKDSNPNDSLDFGDLRCSQKSKPSDDVNFGSCNFGRGKIIRLGYHLPHGLFEAIVELCHDEQIGTTVWAKSLVRHVLGAYKVKGLGKPSFSIGTSMQYVYDLSGVYKISNQMKTFLEIFENNWTLVQSFINRGNYLEKGHLAPRADQYYYPSQLATYFYSNSVPMWLSINRGNWREVESLVRLTSKVLRVDFDIWTGGLGILTLSEKKIFLAKRKNDTLKNSSIVPVPEIVYKIVLDRSTNEGLVFLVINNPYSEADVMDQLLCDELRQYRQLTMKFARKRFGYTYCCAPADFQNKAYRRYGLSLKPYDFSEVKNLKLPRWNGIGPRGFGLDDIDVDHEDVEDEDFEESDEK